MVSRESIEHRRWAALLGWREQVSDSGVAEDQLPTKADLRRIAQSGTRNRAVLERLPFNRRSAITAFMSGILHTLREFDADDGDAEPALLFTGQPTNEQPANSQPAASASAGAAPPAPSRFPGEPTRGQALAAPDDRAQAFDQNGRVRPADAPDYRDGPDDREGPDGPDHRNGPNQPAESPTRTPPEQPRRSASGSVDPAAFAPWHGAPQEPVATARAVIEGDALRITWPAGAVSAPSVLFRVVVSDDYVPYIPSSGRLVSATRDHEARDEQPMTGAVRHVTVWSNSGDDDAAALQAPPVLVGRTTVVLPVSGVEVVDDHGQVLGRWNCPPGLARVDVLRVPVAEAHRNGYLREHLLPQDEDGLFGFTDSTCVPGQTYEYRCFSVALVEGAEATGPPVIRRLHVAAALTPVVDLTAEQRVDDGRIVIDLTWTGTPSGTVLLYRTDNGPTPGVESNDIAESALEGAGLAATARLPQRARLQPDGRSTLSGVVWPDEMPRVHFTVVALLDGLVRVGSTVTLTRAAAVREVRLVERVDWQLLTFDWPIGADLVHVYITAPGLELESNPQHPVAQLDRSAYEAQGGLRLQDVLAPRGCDLHLVPATYHQGRVVYGATTTEPYPGLLRLRYRLVGDGAVLGGLMRRLGRLTLEVRSDEPLRQSPPFVLVHNPERLPLDLHDGDQVFRVSGPLPKGEWTVLKEFQLDRDRKGWLRLFADWDKPGPAVALLDPPVSSLLR